MILNNSKKRGYTAIFECVCARARIYLRFARAREERGEVFVGYSRGIHGVFMGYTYVSGMFRECIGYVSGMYRKIRGGENEEKMIFLAKKIW